jgi:CubicO group peptidase (beta-lactamase class C family)
MNRKTTAIWILCAALAPMGCAGATNWPNGFDPAARAIIDAEARALVDEGRAPGVVLLVGRGDEVLMREAYGRRYYESDEPMTFDTLFDLASITKATCTSAAVMLLVQDGRIGLDDPASRHMPEYVGRDKEDITIRQLLTHTSGLAAYTNAARLEADAGPGPNPNALIERIAIEPKAYPTGRGYTYSCLNYLTLARVVQNVTGRNMEEFLRERLWAPLGMKDTTFFPTDEQIARTAPTIRNAAEFRRGDVHDPLAHYAACPEYAPGNAGAFSTVEDMARYVRMLLAGGELEGARVFDRAAWEAITTDQAPPEIARRTAGWDVYRQRGYSTALNDSPETLTIGHTGYTGTMIWMDKLSGAYVILFTNCVYPTDSAEDKSAVVAARRRIVRTAIEHLDVYQGIEERR